MTGRPDVRRAGIALAVSLALAAGAQVALQAAYARVDAPLPLLTYGLLDDPGTLRSLYASLQEGGRLGLLIRVEVIDLGWAAALALATTALPRFVGAAGWHRRPRPARWMVRWAALWALPSLCDVVENAFSLAMLTQPGDFPAWWAGAHGLAARAKLAATGLAVLSGLILTTIVAVRPRRRAAHADESTDVEFLPSP
ncbi:hypothetical protein G7070_17025 [Propioniciclava coleopterorum]|uniref:Uncharacterized protein n=1 Tax=Propioniciclava coleopterorum TaxID=2714937 RepID=A0A6G7Y9T2_9ACTN|nr:hypothetical protein [Propioniciclava coleopterorum]QIK73654.1 hypothetical protein G7070_17025 [Propioniciclava coleopterorum]